MRTRTPEMDIEQLNRALAVDATVIDVRERPQSTLRGDHHDPAQ